MPGVILLGVRVGHQEMILLGGRVVNQEYFVGRGLILCLFRSLLLLSLYIMVVAQTLLPATKHNPLVIPPTSSLTLCLFHDI